MALKAPDIKAKYKATIYAGLKREFSPAVSRGQNFPPVADEFWMKLADAISDIAMDLVEEIQTNADVIPGQQVAGFGGGVPGPVVGNTISIGKIK